MTRIYVGNLDFAAREDDIRDLFEAHGQVRGVEIPAEWDTGQPRGFALVCMAREAIEELDGTCLDGRSLRVRPAPAVPPIGFDSLPLNSGQ